MTRILMAGLCPLPFENTEKSFGPGIRTWQMAAIRWPPPATRCGCWRCASRHLRRRPGRRKWPRRAGRGEHRKARRGRILRSRHLRRGARRGPAARGRGRRHPLRLLRAGPPRAACPFWADQFGHVMAEAQAKALLEKANWPIAHFWNLLAPILRHADHLSVVSERQRWAAIGELGMAGRLGWENCGHELVSTMPCALIPRPRPSRRGKAPARQGAARGRFRGLLERRLQRVERRRHPLRRARGGDGRGARLHFVSTGGEIGGHDEKTYRRFEDHVAGSRHPGPLPPAGLGRSRAGAPLPGRDGPRHPHRDRHLRRPARPQEPGGAVDGRRPAGALQPGRRPRRRARGRGRPGAHLQGRRRRRPGDPAAPGDRLSGRPGRDGRPRPRLHPREPDLRSHHPRAGRLGRRARACAGRAACRKESARRPTSPRRRPPWNRRIRPIRWRRRRPSPRPAAAPSPVRRSGAVFSAECGAVLDPWSGGGGSLRCPPLCPWRQGRPRGAASQRDGPIRCGGNRAAPGLRCPGRAGRAGWRPAAPRRPCAGGGRRRRGGCRRRRR